MVGRTARTERCANTPSIRGSSALPSARFKEIQVAETPSRARCSLSGAARTEPGPARDIVAVNAGAAIYVSGLADSIEAGVEKARDLLASGAARRKLDELVEFSSRLKTATQ